MGNFAPRSVFLVPEVVLRQLRLFGNASSVFYSKKSLVHPSAASTGTLLVDSASATQAGKDFVQLHIPPRVPAGSEDPQWHTLVHWASHPCAVPGQDPAVLRTAPTSLNTISSPPGEGTRATAPQHRPPTTKPVSAPGIRSHAQAGASACVGSASATPRT